MINELNNSTIDATKTINGSVTVYTRELQELKMPRKSFMSSISSPKVEVFVDMGNPLLNHTVDGFLKIGTVSAAKVAVEETYHMVKRGGVAFDGSSNPLSC